MPIYEYACQACERRFEVKQGFNDPPLATCERCGGAVTRLISAPAIMFKGSGWYVTDYSDKLKPPGTSSEPADKKDKADGDGKKATGSGDGKKAAASGDGSASTSKPAASSTSGNGDKGGGSSPSSSSPASSGSAAPSST